jgi:hypothetical protein
MPIRLALFLILAMLGGGCMSAEQRAAAQKSRDWMRTQAVYVRAFDAEDVMTVGATGSIKGVGVQIAKGVASDLKDHYGVNATYLKTDDSLPTDGVLVEGDVGRLYLGDARSWLTGMSNGKATCGASGKVTAEGRVVGEFNASESSSMGAFSSDYLKMLDECIDFVTMSIAEQIATGRYRAADD